MAQIGSLGGKAKRPTTPKPAGPEAKPQTIGELIKSLRVAAGLSRRELAERADLTAATIKRVESGGTPHISTLEQLRRVAAMKELERLARDAGLL
jgi:transcriptional regulator with XRE-family HTH domain